MNSLTRDQTRRVDRLAVEELGMPSLLLMENAAINATAAILDMLENSCGKAPDQASTAVLCGGGNNGGDGYAIARHLHNWGGRVVIYAAKAPADLCGDAAVNMDICARMGLPIHVINDPSVLAVCQDTDVMVDALLGTGFHGDVRDPLASVIHAINAVRGPCVVAVDTPSGLDCDTGRATGPAVRADVTVTFVDRKVGFDAPEAASFLGTVRVAEIGVPPQLVERVRATDIV